MKQTLQWVVMLAAMVAGGMSRAEMYYIVEISDMERNVTHEIMTASELREIKKTIGAEARLFSKACELARKDWDAAEKSVDGLPPSARPFPSGMLAPRRCQERDSSNDQAKVQKRLTQIQAAAFAQQNKGKDKEQDSKKKPKKEDKNKLNLAAERTRAAMAVRAKLDSLIAGTAAPAADEPAAEEPAADEAAAAKK